MTFPSIEAPDYVDAELFYLQPTDAKPVTYSPAAAPTPAPLPPAAEAHAVRITNARKAGATFSLDQNGFELHAHRSEVADFSDEQLIRERYYPESEALLRKR
ncbi:MAG: hypothetical protein RLZZ450_3621 [Pseudomonadota bacterium]|jgi:hypothetical protein